MAVNIPIMHPLTSDGGDSLEVTGDAITQHGGPTVWFDESGVPHLRYPRIAEAGTAGLSFEELFSYDMANFEATGNAAVSIATGISATGESIEAWQVPFDEVLPISGRKARFGQVDVTNAP